MNSTRNGFDGSARRAAAARWAAAAIAVLSWVGCGSSSSGGGENTELRFDAAADFQAIESTVSLCNAGQVDITFQAPSSPIGFSFSVENGSSVSLRAAAAGFGISMATFGPKSTDGMYGDGQPLHKTALPGANPAIEFTAPKTGTYLVVVYGATASGLASLSIVVDGEPGCSAALDCDDGDPCTTDAQGEQGCTHTEIDGCASECATDADCDDGDPCTDNACVAGADGPKVCGAAPADCDDADACTSDSCESGVGCKHVPLATPECVVEGCQSDDDCADGDDCTLDACSNGDCSSTPIAGCGEEECDIAAECDDGSVCTVDACEGARCVWTAIDCSDGDECTTDACSPDSGCFYLPAPECAGECASAAQCNDGDPCTIDSCIDAECVHAHSTSAECQPNECDDLNPCTIDTVSGVGCKHELIGGCETAPCAVDADCADGNACTTDSCTGDGAGGFCAHVPLDCDDGNQCTQDSCSSVAGCIFATIGGACDDGDPCTTNDICLAGVCSSTSNACGDADVVPCKLSGAANSEVVCPLRLASKTNTPAKFCAAMQFTMRFDADKVELLQVFDNICFAGQGCFDIPVALADGALPISSGHAISAAPLSLSVWNAEGFGAMVIVNLSDPAAPISTATLGGGNQITGDPQFLSLRFKLQKSIGQAAPVEVRLFEVLCAEGTSQSLSLDPLTKSLGIIITSP